jgi:Ca2+-binding EF-hand superfamily protein|tara:strand:+ start:988 stop:1227 length:240 start_codon:yes stop_codon:yes gene_type:complete
LRRGTQGINGVKRSFKQVDLDKSGTLNYKEFVRALKNYRIDIDEEAQATIFKLFDADGNKEISYEEFIQGVIGKMNGRR